jgi:tRNA 2-thiouridine synthesizing protein A
MSTGATPLVVIDARGLEFPMPLVRLARKMNGLRHGTSVKLLVTDRAAIEEIPSWTADTNNTFLAYEQADGALVFDLRKGPPTAA